MIKFIKPEWPVPAHIRAFTTLRNGGVSKAPFDDFNLAEHVGDHPESIHANRSLLKNELQLPNEPIWLQQTHSNKIVNATAENRNQPADASHTQESNQVCVILTADCLPILLSNEDGTWIAAVHAGWRGLANGVIENTLSAYNTPDKPIIAWLGPAISAANYEVGEEVRETFIKQDPNASYAFIPSPNNRWLANLYGLARMKLVKEGVTAIYGGTYCTYADAKRFYSYRRDGDKTGRMASLIWINNR